MSQSQREVEVAIVGAGPVGLYTAIQLRRAGIFNLVVYDPRAGQYTRPGFLIDYIFSQVSGAIDHEITPSSSHHIKDLERGLYLRAQSLGIRIENKRFVGFQAAEHKKGAKGILISDGATEEFVACNYALDCTGGHRSLVHEVNRLQKSAWFKVSRVSDAPIKKHFIAYGRMSPEDKVALYDGAAEGPTSVSPNYLTAEAQVLGIQKLRAMGWKSYDFPEVYLTKLQKDKVCLYLEMPDDLPQASYDQWLHTVLVLISNKPDIQFHKMPASKTYAKKPNYLSFLVDPHRLDKLAFDNDPLLPVTIPLGDSQIEPDYRLGHGILTGKGRTDALIKSMEIIDGKIYYFDREDYEVAASGLLKQHQSDLVKLHQQRRERMDGELTYAYEAYKIIVGQLNGTYKGWDEDLKAQIRQTFQALEAMHLSSQALQTIKASTTSSGAFKYDRRIGLIENRNGLEKATHDLLHVLDQLGKASARYVEGQVVLTKLAEQWKAAGTHLLSKGLTSAAIDAYQMALTIHDSGIIPSSDKIKIILYSNSIIACNQMEDFRHALGLSVQALKRFPAEGLDAGAAEKRLKIQFHTIKSYIGLAEKALEASPDAKIGDWLEPAKALFQEIKPKLNAKDQMAMVKALAALERSVQEQHSHSHQTTIPTDSSLYM